MKTRDRPTGHRAASVPRVAGGLVRVVHPLPVVLVVSTSTVLAALLSSRSPTPGFLLRVAGLVLCSQVAVGALNDYLDRNSDAEFQPEKPIPAGDCPPAAARALVALGVLGTIVVGATFGPEALALALLGTAAGLAYDLWLKRTPASFLAYIVGFLTLFSWLLAITGRLTIPLLAAYPGGAMALTAAYLAQSLPDVEADAALGQHGLAALLGPVRTLRTAFVLCWPLFACTLVLSLLKGPLVSLLLSLVAGVLLGAAWLRSHGIALDREARKGQFRLIAPAIAALILSGLLALMQLS